MATINLGFNFSSGTVFIDGKEAGTLRDVDMRLDPLAFAKAQLEKQLAKYRKRQDDIAAELRAAECFLCDKCGCYFAGFYYMDPPEFVRHLSGQYASGRRLLCSSCKVPS